MTIYADVIFLENIFMNSIILLATGIILKEKIKIWGNLIASTIGSIYAIVLYVYEMDIYSNVSLKIFLSIAIVYIAFKPINIKSFLKHIIIFYLTSFTFGGVAFALLYFVRPQDILFQNGVLIGLYPIKIILAGGIIGFIIIIIAFKNIKGKLTHKDMYCVLKISFSGFTKEFAVIIDTGNFLRDPITKIPVVVIENRALRGLFPDVLLDNVTDIIKGKESDLGEFSSKIRAIPFKSLGKENGMLLGIKIEEVAVLYQDIEYVSKDVIVGIYNGVLSRSGKYSGLIGSDFIR